MVPLVFTEVMVLPLCTKILALIWERLRKNIIDFFKQHGFQITIEINLKITDFLDIYLDLESDKFYPYRKSNNTPFYENRESNHPFNILQQLQK